MSSSLSLDSIDSADLFESEDAHTRAFSWDDEGGATLAVVEAVTDMLGVEPTEVEPLNDVIETDALNQLFTPTGETLRRTGHIQFEYEGCLVRIQANGTVSVVRATQL
jgi:hypothetical protein